MSLKISRRTLRCAERNSHNSRILAAANIWVARAHVNKPCDSIANKQKQASKQKLAKTSKSKQKHRGGDTGRAGGQAPPTFHYGGGGRSPHFSA